MGGQPFESAIGNGSWIPSSALSYWLPQNFSLLPYLWEAGLCVITQIACGNPIYLRNANVWERGNPVLSSRPLLIFSCLPACLNSVLLFGISNVFIARKQTYPEMKLFGNGISCKKQYFRVSKQTTKWWLHIAVYWRPHPAYNWQVMSDQILKTPK